MKSMIRSSHIFYGIGKGSKNSIGEKVFALFFLTNYTIRGRAFHAIIIYILH